ncbi:gram-negative bacteria-binding protein 2-like, partial [Drosophila grimshawi]|uniref:gram-negative bacteria-binding protein 2-like n=1 Tax=Drosophila grimshawi TaxID=7222 RepID=UPI001C933477
LFGCNSAHGININNINITVYLDGDAVAIRLDDNTEVNSAFFSAEICYGSSSDYIFFHTRNKNDTFLSKANNQRNIQINDILRIIAVFEKDGQGITKPYEFKINEHKKVVKNKKPECDCLQSEPQQDYKNLNCSGTLIFEENFNNQSLSNWTYELRSLVLAAEPEQEFVAYVDKKKNIWLKDNILYLNATREQCKESFEQKNCTSKKKNFQRENECGPIKCHRGGTPPVFSAKLHTKNHFHFKYGRVEIRAKMPIGDWLFPYLILQPVNTESEQKYVNHIRIAYARGNKKLQDKSSMPIGGKVLFGSAVLWPNDTTHTEYMNTMRNPQDELYGERFYNYTLIWHEDRIIFKVDGYKYGTITNKDVLRTFKENDCFIVLGLTAGGGLNFADDYLLRGMRNYSYGDVKAVTKFVESNPFPTWKQPSLMIDYVKVYTTHANEE